MNTRAHKKALKKAQQKTKRNTYAKMNKKIAKRQNESLKVQLDTLLENISTAFTKTKAKINVAIANFKYNLKRPFLSKKESEPKEISLYDLIEGYAYRRQISLALASILILNAIFSSASRSVTSHLNGDELEVEPEILSVLTDEELEFMENPDEVLEEIFEVTKTVTIERSLTSSLADVESEVLHYRQGETIDFTGDMFAYAAPAQESSEPHELTNEEKVAIILDKYGITHDQFLFIVAVVLLEAGENFYEECYNVVSTLFNRISSASCINFVNNRMGEGTGVSLYCQAICPGQYTVSREKVNWLMQTDMTVYAGYQAVIDMLYSGVPSHDYYRFVAPHLSYKYDCVPLVTGGNYYFAVVYNRIPLEDILPNYGKYIEQENAQVEEKVLTLEPAN